MTAKTMTEVLMAHWSASTHADRKPFVDKCDGCGAVIFSWGDPTIADGSGQLAAHQAAALSAAGFGLVADAGAKALEDAAEDFSGNRTVISGPRLRDWLRARAAAVRTTNAHD